MALPARLGFGMFLAPFHRPGADPTLALDRDLELVQWLDTLGFDEAWIGEHHSAGWETIASPEVFIATAAERTRRIRLGTGVISLPYHHPMMVANRIILLDHLTKGRVMLGVGPGVLVTDALMLGIEPTRQREMMAESFDVIMRLMTDPTPLTYKSDWFELHDAVLQLRPYTQPHPPIAVASMQTPSGMRLAGRHGAGVLSVGVFAGQRGTVDLKKQWAIAEEAAAETGRTIRRDDWRLSIPIHLAESRQEARDDVREGGANFVYEYGDRTLGRDGPELASRSELVDYLAENNRWIVGTPDDCIAAIERLDDVSGGFGALLVQVIDWAPREKLLRSFELLARYVRPRFQGSLIGIDGSSRLAMAHRKELDSARATAVETAFQEHERQASGAGRG